MARAVFVRHYITRFSKTWNERKDKRHQLTGENTHFSDQKNPRIAGIFEIDRLCVLLLIKRQ
jgi:hypothetical protein